MSTERRKLLLFDIDGTLLHTGGAGISSDDKHSLLRALGI